MDFDNEAEKMNEVVDKLFAKNVIILIFRKLVKKMLLMYL